VVLHKHPSRGYLYFDSYGVEPPDRIKTMVRKNNSYLEWAPRQIQDDDSKLCGYYCIYAAVHLRQGRSLDKISKQFSLNTPQINKNKLLLFFDDYRDDE
jgi:hypothetical protein